MSYHKTGRKFGRVRKQRKALLSSLVGSLIEHEKIQTTEAKARELRPVMEKLLTSAKKNNLASRRLIASQIGGKASKKLMETIAPKYKDRKGGYTRIIKLSLARTDAAKMAHIEFV